jgi:hypothetical protein
MLAAQAISSKVQDDVFIALFLAAVAVGVVGARMILGALASDKSRHIWRWAYLAIGTVAIAIGVLNPVVRFGMEECQHVLAQMRSDVWPFGWMVTLCFYAGFASPTVISLTAREIWRSPGSLMVAPGSDEYYRREHERVIAEHMA